MLVGDPLRFLDPARDLGSRCSVRGVLWQAEDVAVRVRGFWLAAGKVVWCASVNPGAIRARIGCGCCRVAGFRVYALRGGLRLGLLFLRAVGLLVAFRVGGWLLWMFCGLRCVILGGR